MKSLNGKWHYILDPESERNYTDIENQRLIKDFDGSIIIPNNWQIAGINNFSGTVWFIKKFLDKKSKYRLNILKFYGVDYFCEVWLNGTYLGKHEGYFQHFDFILKKQLQTENVLIVKVTSPKEEPGTVWPDKKKLIKGIFNHHDCRPGGWSMKYGQDLNTGGIWNKVELIKSNKAVVAESKIKAIPNKKYSSAEINVELFLKFPVEFTPANDKLLIEILEPKYLKRVFRIQLNKRRKKYQFVFSIDNPVLWFPYEIGKPQIYTMIISSKYIEEKAFKFGIRKVELDKKQNFFINGRRLFLRGSNIIPAQFLSELTPSRIKKIVKLLKEANVNIVRVHAHVNRKELYEELDEQGILVWQDFSLQWTYDESKEFEQNAIKQIGDMVNQFYNHPSIVFWCCHNEPGNQVYTLDKKLFAKVKRLDRTRIIRQASNYEEHAYEGWYWGKSENYIATPMGPLVTEFGAQALPDSSSLRKFISQDKLFPPHLKTWEYHDFQPDQTFNIAKVNPGRNINEFVLNSQKYQSHLLETAIHYYRRKKNETITGIFQFMFVDGWPSITWSVVDYYLRKKKGYYALKESFKPLLFSVYLRQDQYFPASKINYEIWIINDTHNSYEKLNINIKLGKLKLRNINLINILPDSKVHFSNDDFDMFLPGKIRKGNHKLEFHLSDAKGKTLGMKKYYIKIVYKKLGELIEN